jgi:hypothetical protein
MNNPLFPSLNPILNPLPYEKDSSSRLIAKPGARD